MHPTHNKAFRTDQRRTAPAPHPWEEYSFRIFWSPSCRRPPPGSHFQARFPCPPLYDGSPPPDLHSHGSSDQKNHDVQIRPAYGQKIRFLYAARYLRCRPAQAESESLSPSCYVLLLIFCSSFFSCHHFHIPESACLQLWIMRIYSNRTLIDPACAVSCSFSAKYSISSCTFSSASLE